MYEHYQQSPITVTQIVSFILRYRGVSNAFKDYPVDGLCSCISDAINDSCMVVDADSFGSIRGVIVAELLPSYNRLHIVGLIALSSASMARFALWLRRQRDKDGFGITAMRRGRIVEYDTERFLNKLERYYG